MHGFAMMPELKRLQIEKQTFQETHLAQGSSAVFTSSHSACDEKLMAHNRLHGISSNQTTGVE